MVSLVEQIGWENCELRADELGWHLHLYEAGPDFRYKGTIHHFRSDQVDQLISNLLAGFKRLAELKQALPPDGDYNERHGLVTIRVGRFGDYLSLSYSFARLHDRAAVELVIGKLHSALTRGPQLVAVAKQLAATRPASF